MEWNKGGVKKKRIENNLAYRSPVICTTCAVLELISLVGTDISCGLNSSGRGVCWANNIIPIMTVDFLYSLQLTLLFVCSDYALRSCNFY